MAATSALTRALRAKYGTGRAGRAAVLRKLGLLGFDENLLLSAPPPPANGNGGNAVTLRGEIEKMVGAWLDSNKISDEQIEELYELLDQHAPPEARDQGEEDKTEERFRAFLKARGGLSDEDINRAVQIVCGAADYSPENVFQAGLRGSQIAGDAEIMRDITRLCFSRISREPDFVDRRPSPVKVGMDSAGAAELHRMFPGIERIQLG